jgi:outer membrane protein assembly factor BamB
MAGRIRRLRWKTMLVSVIPAFALTVVPAVAGEGPSGRAVDWPEFAFDQFNTNLNPFETTLDPSNVRDLGFLWQSVVGETVFGAPAVVGGTAYVCAGTHVYALDTSTGGQLWSAAATCESPAVANGTVVVDNSSETLVGLDASTGSTLWTATLGGAGTPAPPTIVDGVVYVGAVDGKFHAVDAATGSTLWVAPTGGPIFDSAAVGDGRVYVESDDQKLYAFDPVSGSRLWTVKVGGGGRGAPVFAGGVVYASGVYRNRLTAVDAATGTVLWTVQLGCTPNQPSLANGVLYVPMKCVLSGVDAYDAATGTFLWHTTIPHQGEVPSPIAVANGVLYFCTTTDLVTLEAATGRRLAMFPLGLGEIPPPTPVVLNASVYVGSTYSRRAFYALGLEIHEDRPAIGCRRRDCSG